jgi:hypothetical protein
VSGEFGRSQTAATNAKTSLRKTQTAFLCASSSNCALQPPLAALEFERKDVNNAATIIAPPKNNVFVRPFQLSFLDVGQPQPVFAPRDATFQQCKQRRGQKDGNDSKQICLTKSLRSQNEIGEARFILYVHITGK